MEVFGYTTVFTILNRGVTNASVGNIIKICKLLNLSVDALAEGEIESRYLESKPAQITDVKDIVNDAKAKIFNSNHLTIDGNDIDIEYIEPIVDALDIGYEMIRKKQAKNITKTITESITESNKK